MTMHLPTRPAWIGLCLCALAWLLPASGLGWGSGMHAMINLKAHERLKARWSTALDRNLLLWAAPLPDVWYIPQIELLQGTCGLACGEADGSIANEGWGDYQPDHTFNYTRHLLANAGSLAEVSLAFGYGAHQIGDYRGHLEYIIPNWRDPEGNGTIALDRHTVVDSVADVLALNVKGLGGYPADFTISRLAWGYADAPVSATNAEEKGGRDSRLGYNVEIVSERGKRKVVWKNALSESVTGLSARALTTLVQNAAESSASEGILAALYGQTTGYGMADERYPIVIDAGAVNVNCATDLAQRLDGPGGFGNPFACLIGLSSVSGLVQWRSFLKPAQATGNDLVLDLDLVESWISKLAKGYSNGDVRLDDERVFEIDPQSGKSTADLVGIDGRHYTLGRTMGEIVSDVLTRNIDDVTERCYLNPRLIGAVWQSKLSPFDKARFVSFDFEAHPTLSAWPATLPYDARTVALAPAAPGPFARAELALDLRPKEAGGAPELVFPYYMAMIEIGREGFSGTGSLIGELALRAADDQPDALRNRFTLDLESGEALELASWGRLTTDTDGRHRLRLLLDNRDAAAYLKGRNEARALVLSLSLAITDAAKPPLDLPLRVMLTSYCERPDFEGAATPARDAAACLWPEAQEAKSSQGCFVGGSAASLCAALACGLGLLALRRRRVVAE